MREINFSSINNPLKNIMLFLNALVIIIVFTNTRGEITTIHAIIIALFIANALFAMRPISEKETWLSYTFNTAFAIFLKDLHPGINASSNDLTILFFVVAVSNMLYIYSRNKNVVIVLGRKKPKYRFLFMSIAVFLAATSFSWFLNSREQNFKELIQPEINIILSEVVQKRNKTIENRKEEYKKISFSHILKDPEQEPYHIPGKLLIKSIETITREKFKAIDSSIFYELYYDKTFKAYNLEDAELTIRNLILHGYKKMTMWQTSIANFLFISSFFIGVFFLLENFISMHKAK